MLARPERGCLAIADISGYTSYLTGSELDHANDVLADLVETVLGRLHPVFKLVKLEGDAAFLEAPEDRIDASMLLDTVEACYFGFQRRLISIRQATTCDCNACVLIPNLNLKFVVHHGSFVRQRIARSEELTGTDVIVVHRLLKNTVSERLGLNGYAMYTAACVTHYGIDAAALGMIDHRETYEHIGDVQAFVVDLERRWREERERRTVVVPPGRAAIEAQAVLRAPAPVVWEYVTSPSKRPLWQGSDRVDERAPNGRRGIGTTNHCVHGADAVVEQIIDWRPFEYLTYRSEVPGFGPILGGIELEELPEGTKVTMRFQKPASRRQQAMLPHVVAELEPQFQAGFVRLGELLEKEGREAGWAARYAADVA